MGRAQGLSRAWSQNLRSSDSDPPTSGSVKVTPGRGSVCSLTPGLGMNPRTCIFTRKSCPWGACAVKPDVRGKSNRAQGECVLDWELQGGKRVS